MSTDPRDLTPGAAPPSLESIERGMNRDLEKTDDEGGPTRAAAAVALRIAGASFTSIAKELGYSSAYRARQAFERSLAESISVDAEDDLAKVRYLNGRRLERLLQSLWGRATNPRDVDHLAYARTALAVIDRHSKLMGTDAPQQMVVHTPSANEVEAWIVGMVNQVKGDAVGEADIIEGEIVEDEARVLGDGR